jgi:hypothetical protein
VNRVRNSERLRKKSFEPQPDIIPFHTQKNLSTHVFLVNKTLLSPEPRNKTSERKKSKQIRQPDPITSSLSPTVDKVRTSSVYISPRVIPSKIELIVIALDIRDSRGLVKSKKKTESQTIVTTQTRIFYSVDPSSRSSIYKLPPPLSIS